jgi:DNA polymerase-1
MSDDVVPGPSPGGLILFDGHNVAYRMFHAIQGLSRRDGHPTNAIFGFLRLLDAVRRIWNPSHWCVLFDGGLPRHRMDALSEYKAQRAPMPEDLRLQLADLMDYLPRARIPFLRIEGQEADDVIATAARRAAGSSLVRVVSSDKDLFQLCSERVTMILPADLTRAIGPADVLAKTGVPPERTVEWLALTGDTADNIPGIPGVGPKTATLLVQACAHIREFLACPDRAPVTPRIRKNLADHREAVLRNLELVRLRDDLPLPSEWNTWVCADPVRSEVRPWLESMELHSLVRALKEPELF